MRSAFISGRLTADPDVQSVGTSEYSVIKFDIANDDESRKNQNGEYENVTSFFRVEYWTKNPQKWLYQDKLAKGNDVTLEADIKQNRWETSEGQKRSMIVFSVKRGTFPKVIPSRSNAGVTSEPEKSSEEFDDDIPF